MYKWGPDHNRFFNLDFSVESLINVSLKYFIKEILLKKTLINK